MASMSTNGVFLVPDNAEITGPDGEIYQNLPLGVSTIKTITKGFSNNLPTIDFRMDDKEIIRWVYDDAGARDLEYDAIIA